jgi:large subunit ribosomal protein L6
MSRIGKKPVEAPKNVKVAVSGGAVTVEGPLGSLSMNHRPEVDVSWDESSRQVRVAIGEADMANRQVRAYWGLTRSLIQNMVTGVNEGYSKTMEVSGVGYTAEVQGNKLKLTVGFANPIFLNIPPGIEVVVDRQIVRIKGYDKQAVGHFAAQMRAVRKPEPYKGKGIKYAEETIRRKQGKQFGS